MDSSAFNGIGRMITVLFVGLIILLPFGLWKLVEIGIWLWHHISISLK